MDHRLKEHLIILVCLSVTVIPTFTRKYRTFGELICGSTFFLARSTSHTCTYIGGEGKLNNFKEYIIFKKRPILIKICSECSKISENRSQLNFWVVYRCGKKIFKMLRTLNRQTLWSRNENRISVTKISEKKRFQKSDRYIFVQCSPFISSKGWGCIDGGRVGPAGQLNKPGGGGGGGPNAPLTKLAWIDGCSIAEAVCSSNCWYVDGGTSFTVGRPVVPPPYLTKLIYIYIKKYLYNTLHNLRYIVMCAPLKKLLYVYIFRYLCCI